MGGPDPFAGLPVMELHELDQRRGGFEFQGLQFEFGANLRTFIDGVLALESVINIAKDGVITRENLTEQGKIDMSVVIGSQQIVENGGGGLQTEPDPLVGGVSSLNEAPTTADPPTTAVPTAVVEPGNTTVGNPAGKISEVASPTDVHANNIDLSGAAATRGVIIQDVKGYTAALHEIRRDQILSLIVNAANDRTIRQEVDVSVTVENFKQFQRSVLDSRLNGRIGGNRLP
jgi:hypothetical protein